MPYAPIPDGRGRWRLTLHRRAFAPATYQSTMVAVLSDARARKLVQAWDAAAELDFTLNGRSAQAALIQELATEVIAWRWDENSGADVPMFRGLIDHAEDQVTADQYSINVVCHDYFALLQRRILTAAYSVTQTDQDSITAALLSRAVNATASSGTSFAPGSWLPLVLSQRNPDGTARAALSGQLRDRTYLGSQNIGQAIDDLAKVIGGFDYDVQPLVDGQVDALRVFYPNQGVIRSDISFMYGSNVSALTRTVASSDYANYVRVLGNNGSSDPNAAQLFGEVWNSDADNVTVNPVGLWMNADNAADVTIQSTLNDQAAGDLNVSGLLTPSYTLTLAPGAYSWGNPNMGDTVPVIVIVGRLNVNTSVRVVGLEYDIGDDGQEDVALTLGRSPTSLAKLFTQADRDVDALTRR